MLFILVLQLKFFTLLSIKSEYKKKISDEIVNYKLVIISH